MARTDRFVRFAGEEQDAARARRVRNRAQNDVGQAVRGRAPDSARTS